MNVLASDFSGLTWMILAVPLLLIAAGVSFVPSARGHWSGPVLAAPLLLLGLLLNYALLTSGAELSPWNWTIALAPLAIGTASFVLWAFRLHARARSAR